MPRNSSLLLRPYTDADKAACRRIFRSNVPAFFHPEEERVYLEALDAMGAGAHPFLVLEREGQIAGAGGYRVPAGEENVAVLSWGTVDRGLHGERLGEILLLGRLVDILELPGVSCVRVETTPAIAGFFERYGFIRRGRVADGIIEGYDAVELTLDLRPARRREIQAEWRRLGADVARG